MKANEDMKDLSLDMCFFMAEKMRHNRVDELMVRLGLSRGQPTILFEIGKNNGCTQKELSERMFIRPASVTSMLQRMERSGYVKRIADENDLRVMRVFLTDKGFEMLENSKKLLAQMEYECYKNFTDEERIMFRKLLIQIRENLLNLE